MDTHFKGSRGDNGYGAAVIQAIAGALFGVTVAGTTLVLKTYGATPTTPLFVRIDGQIKTAFDGTGAAFTLQQTDLDDSNPTSLATIAGFTAGKFTLGFFLTADKKFNLVYATGTTPTVGEGYYSIQLAGKGQSPV